MKIEFPDGGSNILIFSFFLRFSRYEPTKVISREGRKVTFKYLQVLRSTR